MARLSLRVVGPPFIVVEDDDDDKVDDDYVDRPASHAAAFGGNANFICSCGTGIGLLAMKHGSICSSENFTPPMDCAYYKMKCPPKPRSRHLDKQIGDYN